LEILKIQEIIFTTVHSLAIFVSTSDCSSFQREGMKVGDFIVDVMGTDVKWSSHEEVVGHIRGSGAKLVMKLVTPMDWNFLEKKSPSDEKEKVTMRTPEGTIADKDRPEKRRSRLSWMFRKKESQKDKDRNRKISM
jgi:hypothetical protein